jgi:hypothetical protein
VLFYFAGHGEQDAGINNLAMCQPTTTDSSAATLQDIYTTLNDRKCEFGIIGCILDTCRETPGGRGHDISNSKTLAVPSSAGQDSFIAFACAERKFAYDQAAGTSNGQYTHYLVNELKQEADALPRSQLRDIQAIMRSVCYHVREATAGSQEPWYHECIANSKTF